MRSLPIALSILVAIACALHQCVVQAFNLMDYTHYFDYIPYRKEDLVFGEDYRTAINPPNRLRRRKMETGTVHLQVEDVLLNPVWPTKWPYGFEDFRPLDYTHDVVMNTYAQYKFSQSLAKADHVTLIPGLLRLPIRRHYVFPKDKFALCEHMEESMFDGAKVLELFSCYETILPEGFDLGPTVGVGFDEEEMNCNPRLDDYIEQDLTMDPYLSLADNYFDIVVMPAMFQLLQRPKEMFEEINRVLKPGGIAVIGVKLTLLSVYGKKRGRYYVETNYLEDVMALGSFFHYAEGYTRPQAYDLNLPEFNIVGKVKDALFPEPRMDFYACVQARKKKNSPHGGPNTVHLPEDAEPEVKGKRYAPSIIVDPITKEETLGPFY